MSAVNEDIPDVMRRFKWVNENVIHVINQEGIELLVDTEDKFKEIEFNFIPLYDPEICKTTHYMWDHPSYDLDENLKTLIKRYQHYKSAYYLKRALDPDYNMY